MSPAWRVPSRIETERLVIRRYDVSDAEQLVEVIPRNLEHLARYMEWTRFEPQTVEQRREWIADEAAKYDDGTEFTMGMFTRDGALLGGTGFHVRTDPDRLAIGYWIDADHEGRGLVTEAAGALTLVALEAAGAEVVSIAHAPTNLRSAAVPARLGYTQRDGAGERCFDTAEMAPAVEWRATREDLAREPLASWPRPASH